MSAADRIVAYLDARSRGRGIDQMIISGYNDEELRTADLRDLISENESLVRELGQVKQELRHEIELRRGVWRRIWCAVHDRNDAPEWWDISEDELICAIQDADTAPVAVSPSSKGDGNADAAE